VPLRDTLRAFFVSRGIVWLVGVPAFLLLPLSGWQRSDPTGLTRHLGSVGEVLGAPAIRWDSSWYVAIAQHGYESRGETAFFPLYPAVTRVLATVTVSEAVAGVLVSLVAFAAGLYLLRRLAELEIGAAAANRAVWLLALFPAAVFFSAVYTEGLFLALSVGAVYAARRGSWAWAGALGGAAALTRNTGVLIGVAVLLLYLYGPRGGEPARSGAAAPSAGEPAVSARWRPRYPLRPDVLWLALIPAGLGAFLLYCGVVYDDPFATWHAQAGFERQFSGLFSALWYGARDAVDAAGSLLGLGGGFGTGAAVRTIGLFLVVVGALVAAVGTLRRLPVAYGAYALAALVPPLSAPWPSHPLWSTPRFVAVLFPLFMWLGLRLGDRRWFLAVSVLFGLGLAYCAARFSAWYWVA
jgi:hypothetical protein